MRMNRHAYAARKGAAPTPGHPNMPGLPNLLAPLLPPCSRQSMGMLRPVRCCKLTSEIVQTQRLLWAWPRCLTKVARSPQQPMYCPSRTSVPLQLKGGHRPMKLLQRSICGQQRAVVWVLKAVRREGRTGRIPVPVLPSPVP